MTFLQDTYQGQTRTLTSRKLLFNPVVTQFKILHTFALYLVDQI